MARVQGTFNFSANFETLTAGPLDARAVVQYVSDLTSSGVLPYPYNGMPVVVVSEAALSGKNGLYILLDKDNYTNISSWEKVGSNIDTSALVGTGSFNDFTSSVASDSASFDNRINTISSSYYALSGSYTIDSASFEFRIRNINPIGSGSSGYFAIYSGSNQISSSIMRLSGSTVVVDGGIEANKLTVNELYTQIVTSSVSYSTGSNKFGETAADTQQFTGSVTISGSLAVNGPIVGYVSQSLYNPFSASVASDSASFDARINSISSSLQSKYSSSTPSATTSDTIGGIAAGTAISTLNGLTISAVLDRMFLRVIAPTLNTPSFSGTVSPSSLQEIGSLVNLTLTGNYNRGSIYNGATFQNFRGGAATEYRFVNNTIGNITQADSSYGYNNYSVVQGSNSFSFVVTASAGPQPLDNFGNASGSPLGATTYTANSSFEGVYPIFATTNTISGATKQSLVSMIGGNYIQLSLVAESGGNKQTFWLPNPWIGSRPLVSIQYFNTVSNQFDTTNKVTDFTTSSDTFLVQGNSISYTKYTNNTSDRGALLIRLIF